MKHCIRSFCVSLILLAVSSRCGFTQQQTFYDDNAPKRYNESVQPIYEEINSLRERLLDDSMSMSDAAEIVEQESSLRRKADALWESTQEEIDSSFRESRDAINAYNTSNKDLGYESALLGSRADLLNNVGKYPVKEAFEANKAQLSDEWEKNFGTRLKPFGEEFAQKKDELFRRIKEEFGTDMDAEGYSRIGTSNPYTGEVYYKYYDQDGNFKAGQWQDDAAGYAKWREDNNASLTRQRDLRQQLQQDSTALKQFDNQFRQNKAAGQRALSSVENGVRRINFVGQWDGRDNVGNWLKLRLNADGTTHYSWGKTSTVYSGDGTWSQSGSSITMQTNDGSWRHQSTITAQYQLQFIETGESGNTYRNYLSRR